MTRTLKQKKKCVKNKKCRDTHKRIKLRKPINTRKRIILRKNTRTQKVMTCETYIKSKKFNVYLDKLWDTKIKFWINVKPSELKKYKTTYKNIFKYIIQYACVHNLGYFAKGHPENPLKNKNNLPIPDVKPSKKVLDQIMKYNAVHVSSILSGIKN
jgi:hypothetical protein